VWVLTAVLLAAAGYELMLALEGTVGPESGEAPPGEEWVSLVSFAAVFFAACVAIVSPGRRYVFPLAPAAAAFVTARFYTPDPYYAPTLRRYSEGGLISPGWVLVVLAFAFVAALVTFMYADVGVAITAVVLLLLLGTALFMGAGH
jgi:hypothetical protein